MDPRLVSISGPLEGQTFRLAGESFSIGRHASNDLQLATVEVSRHHCELRRSPEGTFQIVDLESRHGLLINGRRVHRQVLLHSDLLTLGSSTFLFLLDDASSSSPSPVTSEISAMGMATSLARKPTEMLYLDPVRVEAALPQQARIARDLHTLLQVSSGLQGPQNLAQLSERLITAIGEAIPGERIAILQRPSGLEALATLAERLRGESPEAPRPPSRTVLERVIEERLGLLYDPRQETTPAASIVGSEVALCAPLLGEDEDVIGALYVDSPVPGAFDERHLELLGAIAGLASLAFQNALHMRWLESENRRLRAQQLDHDMVGDSPAMQQLLKMIGKVARAETTVLIRGESGTGKELAAQAIHRSSARSASPFIAINCATFSETLFESELFGHEKGAFTGAVERNIGKLEAAKGGTLFLDEVGEIPPALQARLLRVIQERSFMRVGGTRPIQADMRLVAATNRDLETAIRQGRFREDLYYRLKVITLETPPLRQRREDIPLLAAHFVQLHGKQIGRPGVGISPPARRSLMSYDWPGNVRELGNVIERALVLGEDEVIHPEDLPDEVVAGAAATNASNDGQVVDGPPPGNFQDAVLAYKRQLILDTYRQAGHDYASTAQILGIHVNSLHRMISRLGIKEQLDT